MANKKVNAENKRSSMLYVPMTAQELAAIEAKAQEVGWSRASIARYAIARMSVSQLQRGRPRGNRRRLEKVREEA